MAYATWSVVFGEQPSASKWNILGSNDASFNDGTGIGTDAIKSSKLFYGLVRYRQGGASGDATWITKGTTNTATDAKDVFIQVGSITGNTSGSDTAIVFPTAYTYAPLVFATAITANSANIYAAVNSITTTGCNVRQVEGNGSAESIAWMAIGQ